MDLILFIVAYAAVAVFAIAVVMRFLMYSRMPMHLRWELYPVPHEASRAHYGGSYYEEVDWWKKPREHSKLAEGKAMFMEIVFLIALKENNPKLWIRSFPFHFGLYLIIAATFTMFGLSILVAISPEIIQSGFGSLVMWAIKIFAVGGICLGLFGAVGLLERRLNDPDLKDFTAPADIFNVVFFVVTFGLALVNIFVNGMEKVFLYVYGLLTFNTEVMTTIEPNALFVVSIVLLAALLTYIPLTHMSHFVAKYFAYHSIRWNDEPNLKGGPQEEAIGKLLKQPVTWAAPHVDAKGEKSWADLATEEVTK